MASQDHVHPRQHRQVPQDDLPAAQNIQYHFFTTLSPSVASAGAGYLCNTHLETFSDVAHLVADFIAVHVNPSEFCLLLLGLRHDQHPAVTAAAWNNSQRHQHNSVPKLLGALHIGELQSTEPQDRSPDALLLDDLLPSGRRHSLQDGALQALGQVNAVLQLAVVTRRQGICRLPAGTHTMIKAFRYPDGLTLWRARSPLLLSPRSGLVQGKNERVRQAKEKPLTARKGALRISFSGASRH